MSHHKKAEHHVRPYKILAQSFGIIVCGFFLFLIFGETLPGIASSAVYEINALLPTLVLLPAAGFVITYFNELYGATIIAIAAVMLFVYFSFSGDYTLAFIFSIPYLIVTALFILHINKRNQLNNRK